MKRTFRVFYKSFSLKNRKRISVLKALLLSFLILSGTGSFGQEVRNVRGNVADSEGNPIAGATIVIQGSMTGTVSDAKGDFSLQVPADGAQILVVSFIGMLTEEVNVQGLSFAEVTMIEDIQQLQDVVVVGYGRQKKESVVGAISQTSGEVLERAGGVTNIGAALTGNIPGLITLQGTGEPGDEDPIIYIRGQGTWNFSNPLVLVDGVERTMSEIDFKSVESISVLKDASATAVFGVKGANGVILITTKRGEEGRTRIEVNSSTTMKIPSRIPGRMDSYDALRVRNMAIEREIHIKPELWQDYTPLEELENYRNPPADLDAERYPNIDWQEESFKDYAMSYNTNVNISGGTEFVRYFTSMDYLSEGDIMNVRENGKGYTPGYGYDRVNIRSNLDFSLTKTTTLSTNLSGSYGNKKDTWSGFEYTMWQAAYSNPPDVFPVQYSDGAWGYYPADLVGIQNSVRNMSNMGVREEKKNILLSDFTLNQDLGMILKGLTAKGTFSMDNTFVSYGGIYDGNGAYAKWISPEGDEYYENTYGNTKYDYIIPEWSARADELNNGMTIRKLFYQFQLYWGNTFGKNDISAMGLFNRDKHTRGSRFPSYREDWVFRTTYNYDTRYFVEFNGSYNGSEKFSSDYRFDFFPSIAVGWVISNELFMEQIKWIDNLKIRGSYGLVGNDKIYAEDHPDYDLYRFLFLTEWEYGGEALLGSTAGSVSPYTWYREGAVGNPDIHWETVTKRNLGIEFSFLYGAIMGNIDLFKDYRREILIKGEDRAVVDYLGATPPSANLGEVEVQGYEIELKFNYRFANGINPWANVAVTHAKDRIIFADDAQLLPDYQKTAGYQIGQYRSQMLDDFVDTWDEVYGSTQWNTNDNLKLPGEYNLIDFNGDGIIDSYDSAPNGFPERPQNTFNYTIGINYKKFGFFVQFYGVNNVTRYIALSNFPKQHSSVTEQGEYWSKDNTDAESFVPRYSEKFEQYGNYYAYDGSYFRLKNAELSYKIESPAIKKIGIGSLRVYLNGNNLLLWTKMPDDRESNLGGWGSQGAYPTVRRINLGVNVVL